MSGGRGKERKIGPFGRLALDLGPLLVFFAAYELAGAGGTPNPQDHHALFVATGAFMVAALAALAGSYGIERKIAPIPLFTAVLVMIFGGLTLWLHNGTFIKMKPTVLYACFGLTLLVGLAYGHLFIKYIFAAAFELTETGWRALTWRWGVFFLLLAALNEIVWRNFAEPAWVKFKVFGIIPLIMLFALAQMPLVLKHEIKEKSGF
ncbi:MAG: septation protein A [Alphaproteobacteria bacterium]|nr:septation protein A [Alphaproteobacteria bacterium]MBV9063037.1 septation protein A [Alphaproteobacteria bacterium]